MVDPDSEGYHKHRQEEKDMNIKEVEKLTGFSKPNIRYYEEAGLISPRRDERNNYRVYSQKEIDELMRIKKLRFLGISIEAIKAYRQGEKSLAELLTGRLEEIDSDEGILEKQAQVCRQTIRSGIDNIEDIQIDEAAEAWQKRLMALLRDDIVHHSLSLEDFNKDVLLTYLAGCGIAILTNIIWMIFSKTSITGSGWFGLALFLGIVIFGIVPIWSGSMQSCVVSLFASSGVSVLFLWVLLTSGIQGFMPGYGLLNVGGNVGGKEAAGIIFLLYGGLAVLACVAWTMAQICPGFFRTISAAVVLSGVFVAFAHSGSKLICAGGLSIQTQVEIALLALLFSILHTGQWIRINREKEHFTRYEAMVATAKMTNVVFALVSGNGYYGSKNLRR